MRFIPTVAHGIADYLVGLMVLALPFYFGWSGSVRIFFATLGGAVICYSVVTDYELGLIRVLRIRFHLVLDALFGLAMLAAPSLLPLPNGEGSTIVYLIGALAILLAITTKIRAQGTGSETTVQERT